jgi:putative transposase
MGCPYSLDLRERVVKAVAEGLSYEDVAERFGISPSTVKRWMRRLQETGSFAPGQMGGHKGRKIHGDFHAWLVGRCTERAFTLRGLVAELSARGLKVDYRAVRQFVFDQNLRFKKRHMWRRKEAAPPLSGDDPNGGNARS